MPKPAWLSTTKAAPAIKPESIPPQAQWLSGEGDGSWFAIESVSSDQYLITRFSAKGKIECKSIFECQTHLSFSISKPYTFVHLSHCREVRILQDNHTFLFTRREKII